MVQWLGLYALSAKGLGWIPGQELRNYVAHKLHSVMTKKKKKDIVLMFGNIYAAELSWNVLISLKQTDHY